jgi:hypothetical protein
MGERAIEVEEPAAVRKGIRRYIQDAHHTRAREIKQVATTAE